MKIKAKVMIIFFTGLLGLIIVASMIFVYTDYWYKKIDELTEQIEESNHYLYYNYHDFYYKGEKYRFDDYVGDKPYDRICFINCDYLIYSNKTSECTEYYAIDNSGNTSLIYMSQSECYIDAYRDGLLFFTTNKYLYKKIKYIVYDTSSQIESEISIEDYYLAVYNTKYLLTYDDLFFITDTSTGIKKSITIDKFLNNSMINELYKARKKLMNSDMKIRNVYFIKNEIYVDISIENTNGITVKYDFESGKTDIVGKVHFKWLEHIKSAYLVDTICQPIEWLLTIGD